MRKTSKVPKIVRKCLTEQTDTFYPQHLVIKKKTLFPDYLPNPQLSPTHKRENFNEETNFGFSVTNQFVFILLHLKSKNDKNMLNLNIPEVCVFVDKMPHDIIFSQDGFIRSYRAQDTTRCRLRDLQIIFKQIWKNKKLPKNEHITAVFKQKQVLLMSQTDFIIVCKKIKNDPFFKKLEYIQNKVIYVGQEIVTEYDSKIKQEELLKMATQSLLGFRNQKQIQRELGEQRYLSFLNQKISLVLNYQHNIRINRANFHYMKNQNHEFILVNVTNLNFANLTRALKLREERLKQIEEERDKLLILSPQKQRKYRSYQKPHEIMKIQSLMKNNFESTVKQMNFYSISESKNQQIKNEEAFRKLHPEISEDYKSLFTSSDFKTTKKKIFGNSISGRKPISIPSKYILRSYNKSKRSYTLSTNQGEVSTF